MEIASDITEALRDPPFPLYGVPGLEPRTVATYSNDNPLTLAGLGHGDQDATDQPWVEVITTGPLHGTSPDGPHGSGFTWETRAEDEALFYVVVSNNPAVDGPTIPDAQAALAQHWSAVELAVDGGSEEFNLVSDGPHWDAIRHIEPDHAIVVRASNISPQEVALQRVLDPEPYLRGI